jgi:hypothetical protein
MPSPQAGHARFCGRSFSAVELESIRELIASDQRRTRAELSRLVCEQLDWRRPDGRLKDMSCRVAMLRMERAGLIALPPPRRTNGNGRRKPRLTSASHPQMPVTLPAGALGELDVREVQGRRESSLWNELIERYHYLGYEPLPGAQIRYFVFGGSRLLAALGFGAAAWKVAPRDRFIGWTHEHRSQRLRFVVNNARFLIMPWVRSRNLASHLLSRIVKRLPQDWETRYGYRPVLLETFVETRFRGTCYLAANWIDVGQTQGRGKLDRHNLYALPVKRIFLHPLRRDFRRQLCTFDHPLHGRQG